MQGADRAETLAILHGRQTRNAQRSFDLWRYVSRERQLGTEITLEVNGLTLDWSKNSRGNDHGMLFQPKDRKRIRSDQIDYDYFKENDEDPAPMEMGFCRPLGDQANSRGTQDI